MAKIAVRARQLELSGAPSVGTPSTACFRASYHRVSVLLNVFFIFNLVTTPLLAYLSEPFPWAVPSLTTFTNVTFDQYNADAIAMFQAIFNNEFMPHPVWFKVDATTLSYATRKTNMTVRPASELIESPLQQLSELVAFPGAVFYGLAQHDLMYAFLVANDTARASSSWRKCQFGVLLRFRVAHGCVWIEKQALSRHSAAEVFSPTYTMYYAAQVFEDESLCWVKLGYRIALTLYVMFSLWSKYYQHVHSLHVHLNKTGLVGSHCTRFEIMLGDPSGLIVSDPVVASVMVLDIWINAPYLGVASIQVSQITDLWRLGAGCVYAARCVWGALLLMCLFTVVIKRWKWERLFAPVDPAVMTVAAYVYGGPLAALCSRTHVMAVFHFLLKVTSSPARAVVETELFGGVLGISLVMSSVPLMYSLVYNRLGRRVRPPQQSRRSRVATTLSARHSLLDETSHMAFNDLKHRLVYSMTRQSHIRDWRGGSMHKLFQKDPRHRVKPMLSILAVDVFVFAALDARSPYVEQVRLSLVSLIDRRLVDPTLAIARCSRPHHASVGTLGDPAVCTYSGAPSNPLTCLHLGETHWVM